MLTMQDMTDAELDRYLEMVLPTYASDGARATGEIADGDALRRLAADIEHRVARRGGRSLVVAHELAGLGDRGHREGEIGELEAPRIGVNGGSLDQTPKPCLVSRPLTAVTRPALPGSARRTSAMRAVVWST